jgi:hypothetical protein
MEGNLSTLEGDAAIVYADEGSLDGSGRRQRRARTERMVVIPEADRHGYATGLYQVVTTGGSYIVEPGQGGRCTCPDHQFNHATCKHFRRVTIMFGETDLPEPNKHVRLYAETLRDLIRDLWREHSSACFRAQFARFHGENMNAAEAEQTKEKLETLLSRI